MTLFNAAVGIVLTLFGLDLLFRRAHDALSAIARRPTPDWPRWLLTHAALDRAGWSELPDETGDEPRLARPLALNLDRTADSS